MIHLSKQYIFQPHVEPILLLCITNECVNMFLVNTKYDNDDDHGNGDCDCTYNMTYSYKFREM